MKENTVTRYKIRLDKPGMKAGKLRAAFITDLHNTVWNNDRDHLPDLIARQKPDLILCGGDMIVARPEMSVLPGLYFMKRMLNTADVYFALGNHEYRSRIYPETYGSMYEDFIRPLKNQGMILLDNEKAAVDIHGIRLDLFGLSIEREKYRRFRHADLSVFEMKKMIGMPDPDNVSILLAHNPKYYRTYMDWGADLTLCGHYHGGIGRIGKHTGMISPGLMPFPTNAYGRFSRNGHTAIVSAGLGEHTIPLRINNPRELVLLDIYVNTEKGG